MSKRDWILALVIVIAALILALIGFGVVSLEEENRGGEFSVRDLPKEMLRAVYYANESSSALKSVLGAEKPIQLPPPGEVVETARKIMMIVEELESSQSDLAAKIARMGEAYALLAYAAGNASRAARVLSPILADLYSALVEAKQCRTKEFIGDYEPLEPRVREAISSLKKAEFSLAEVDSERLGSKSHREVYRGLEESVEKLLEVLEKAERLYKVSSKNPGLVEAACRASRSPSAKERSAANSLLAALGCDKSNNSGNSGGQGYRGLASTILGHPLAELLEKLEALARGENSSTSQKGQHGGQGMGAGYGAPESDD